MIGDVTNNFNPAGLVDLEGVTSIMTGTLLDGQLNTLASKIGDSLKSGEMKKWNNDPEMKKSLTEAGYNYFLQHESQILSHAKINKDGRFNAFDTAKLIEQGFDNEQGFLKELRARVGNRLSDINIKGEDQDEYLKKFDDYVFKRDSVPDPDAASGRTIATFELSSFLSDTFPNDFSPDIA